jgi:membrane-bound serine protease (ClpP class)
MIFGVMLAKLAMLPRFMPIALLAFGLSAWLGAQEAERNTPRTATLLSVNDGIGPATSDYVERGIKTAVSRGSALIVIEMDTPGGLDTSMRDIIQAILASPLPVVTFVYPQGARAASAGTYILYASHVAAMAPATNLGAATPVAIGGTPAPAPAPAPTGGDAPDAERDQGNRDGGGDAQTGEENQADEPDGAAPSITNAQEPTNASERKAINDAVAYIRSLAEQRGRNADWAERAVRAAESLSAQAALEAGVIDLIANDLDDLLTKLDGRQVSVNGNEQTLDTDGMIYERVEPDWRTRLLAVITNPTVAYMLMLLGIYGLIFEGYNPGAILPGVVGAIALLLALFSFQILPVNYAGLALIVLGIVLMIAEFMVPSFGALGFGGIAAFIFGSVILIDTDVPGYGVSIPLLGAIATTAAFALFGVIWLAMRARTLPVVSGIEQLTRAVATALEDFDQEGAVWVHGERWRARSTTPVHKGQQLRVVAVDNLVLRFEPQDAL